MNFKNYLTNKIQTNIEIFKKYTFLVIILAVK